MALLYLDSFDHYATVARKGWTTSGGTISAGNGRNSTNSYRTSGNNQYINRTLPSNYATLCVGTALTYAAGSGFGTDYFLQLIDGTTVQVALAINSSGSLNAYRGATLLGTASGSYAAGIWVYLELKATIHNTAGAIDVYANGVNVLSLSGINTRSTSNNYANVVRIGFVGTSGAPQPTLDFDDLYICDTSGSVNNDVLGPIRIKATLPDGAGTHTDFTPSAGSNYQNVDEATPDDDTTYNSSTAAGAIDTYNLAALGLTGTVLGVQTNLLIRSNGSGAETIRPKFVLSATDYSGTTVGVSTSYTISHEIFETSPDTATAWTTTEIDGAEFGIELVS